MASASVDVENIDSCCAICMNTLDIPTKLVCRHVFCFVCIKGVTQKRGGLCPLCRHPIRADIASNPFEVARQIIEKDLESTNPNNPFWYYGGESGWWRYNDPTAAILEEAYSKDPRPTFVDFSMGSNQYRVDLRHMVRESEEFYVLSEMVQYRKDDMSRKRIVKRWKKSDIVVSDVAGVAGLPLKNLQLENLQN